MERKLDYKKEYKQLYLPGSKPALVSVPPILFIAVDGEGDPNTSEQYSAAVEIIYALTYTIKMSKLSGSAPDGYFEYVVPPLEGLWRVDHCGFDGRNITDKRLFRWTSMVRQPEFVSDAVFEAARETLKKKKPALDTSRARLTVYDEGLCAQIMHLGPYDDEPGTVDILAQFISDSGYVTDISDARPHHEIYLGDPRKTDKTRLKTVIRHPVRPASKN